MPKRGCEVLGEYNKRTRFARGRLANKPGCVGRRRSTSVKATESGKGPKELTRPGTRPAGTLPPGFTVTRGKALLELSE
ncbi:hypothetical protein IF2G_10261 [Cordyceps javanica]|nr:hypothetical protein IF2G_10261 [Cordyceps javanica]